MFFMFFMVFTYKTALLGLLNHDKNLKISPKNTKVYIFIVFKKYFVKIIKGFYGNKSF